MLDDLRANVRRTAMVLLACFGEAIAARVTTRTPGRFVSGRFRQPMETVVPEKHAAGIAIHVPAALDPNWATEMPSQPIKSNACARRVTTTSVYEPGAFASPSCALVVYDPMSRIR